MQQWYKKVCLVRKMTMSKIQFSSIQYGFISKVLKSINFYNEYWKYWKMKEIQTLFSYMSPKGILEGANAI